MARSASDREVAIWRDSGSLMIRIWAHPGSDRSSIEGIDPFRRALVVRVRERAVEGEANSAITSLLSRKLGCRVVLEVGASSRMKLLRADTDLEPEAALRLMGFQ